MISPHRAQAERPDYSDPPIDKEAVRRRVLREHRRQWWRLNWPVVAMIAFSVTFIGGIVAILLLMHDPPCPDGTERFCRTYPVGKQTITECHCFARETATDR